MLLTDLLLGEYNKLCNEAGMDVMSASFLITLKKEVPAIFRWRVPDLKQRGGEISHFAAETYEG